MGSHRVRHDFSDFSSSSNRVSPNKLSSLFLLVFIFPSFHISLYSSSYHFSSICCIFSPPSFFFKPLSLFSVVYDSASITQFFFWPLDHFFLSQSLSFPNIIILIFFFLAFLQGKFEKTGTWGHKSNNNIDSGWWWTMIGMMIYPDIIRE